MARILSYQYFTTGRVRISGLSDSDSNLSGVSDSKTSLLNSYIDATEKQILKQFLGDDLYDAFIEGLDTDPVPARWTSLKNQLIDSTNYTSPLTAFVFFKWMRDHTTNNIEDGQFTKEGYSINESMLIDLWNEAVDDMEDVFDWLVDNNADYPEWEGGDFPLNKMYSCGL